MGAMDMEEILTVTDEEVSFSKDFVAKISKVRSA